MSVFVPARNEQEIIEASVRSLLTQGTASLAVIDDASTDRTREILVGVQTNHPKLTILSGHGPGPGECGKPAALRSAYTQQPTTTDWVCFVDADVVLEPGAIEALVRFAETRGKDFVSLLPRLELPSILEDLVMPSVGALVIARYPSRKVEDPGSAVAFANGQLILVRREVYDRLGGHTCVISEVLEDVRLAEKAKAQGARLAIVDGSQLARTRMYSSWAEMREGWSKNLALLLGPRSLWVAVLTLVVGWSGIAAVVAHTSLGLVAYGLSLLAAITIRRRMRSRAWLSLLAPIGSVLVSFLILESVWRLRSGRLGWKGRVYGGQR